jgi:hypothetical protein
MADVTLNHFFKRLDFGIDDFAPRGLRDGLADEPRRALQYLADQIHHLAEMQRRQLPRRREQRRGRA